MSLVLSSDKNLEHPIDRLATLVLRVVEQAYDDIEDIEDIEDIVDYEKVAGIRIIRQIVPWTNCQKKMQQRCFSPLTEESAKHLENITSMHITQNHPETYIITNEEMI